MSAEGLGGVELGHLLGWIEGHSYAARSGAVATMPTKPAFSVRRECGLQLLPEPGVPGDADLCGDDIHQSVWCGTVQSNVGFNAGDGVQIRASIIASAPLMSKGWESKNVEQQQAEAGSSQRRSAGRHE